jgi:hypothetical protein
MAGIAGVIAMETNCAGETVTVVAPVMEPPLAEIVASPSSTPVTAPLAETIATLSMDDNHVTVDVRTCVLPSVYVPVAVNCWIVPSASDESAGVTAIDCRAAGNTVSEVSFDVIDPADATIVVDPVPLLVASPLLSIIATVATVELQVTAFVTF